MSLPTGTILGQRYEISAFIGSDGTLGVYKGLDLRLGRDVAMTVLEILTIHAPEELISFEKDAQIRAGLHHPRIMTIHDFGHGVGCAFQIAEWLDGQSLRKRFQDGPLNWKEARNIAEAVLEGLAVIHHKGYTLQILDASSVFLQQDGHVKLFAYQLRSIDGAELQQAEHEGLQALARTLLLVLGDGHALAAPAVDMRILSILRDWARATDQDALAFRRHFEALIRGDFINPPRPVQRRWLARTALVAVLPLLAVVSLQRFHARQPKIPLPVADEKPPHDPESSRLYLQGLALMETLEPDNLRKAQTYLQSTITREPTDGLPYSGLGRCYSLMGLQQVLPKEEALRLGQAAIQRALVLDGRMGEAHAALAFQKTWYAMDWLEAEHEYRKALALTPGNAGIHRDFGAYLALRGQWRESLQQLKAALAQDPLSRPARTSYAVYLHWAGRPGESLEELAKAIDQDPTSRDTLINYREVLEQLGRLEESLRLSDRLAALEAIPERDAVALRTAYESWGQKGYWRERVRQAERCPEPDPTHLAELVALQGDQERAFRLLKRALREKSLLSARIPNSPALTSLRADPRFQQLLQTMGYPES